VELEAAGHRGCGRQKAECVTSDETAGSLISVAIASSFLWPVATTFKSIAWQRPLQGERDFNSSIQPGIPFVWGGEDHRHRLAVHWLWPAAVSAVHEPA
jgi:hypothetical protein